MAARKRILFTKKGTDGSAGVGKATIGFFAGQQTLTEVKIDKGTENGET